ncbi:MAG: 8-amino-7-oxononanoate synthase [Dehalococcoidia bacterium]
MTIDTAPDTLAWLDEELASLREQDLERALVPLDGPQEPEVIIDGQRYILLASNNYLGLATDPRVKAGAVAAVERYGTGAGASRLVSGHTVLHRELEQRLAALKGTEDALVFGSGYLANLGAITALAGPGDAIYSDALNHASIVDGCRLSRAEVAVYPHRDVERLRALLDEDTGRYRRRLIVTDAVFSMDGDLAPLPALVELAERFDAMLMVDEAHATGVLGATGAGAVEHFGLEGRVPVIMGTLSKSLASVGGFIAGSRTLIDYLRNRARPFIYTTGLAPAAAGAVIAALDVIEAEPERRVRVLALARRLGEGLRTPGYDVLPSESAVVPVLVGRARDALDLSSALRRRGVFCPAIRSPTVPEGQSRLRVVPMATHTDDQTERALAAFTAARRELWPDER